MTGSALPLPFPYLPGTVEPDSLESRIQQNFDALAIAVGAQVGYSPWVVVGAAGAPAFQNSWVNTGAAGRWPTRFFKDPLGMVHIQGEIKNGTLGLVVFTLPVGYRPAFDYTTFAVRGWTGSASAFGYGRVQANGDVYVQSDGGVTNTEIQLSNIHFRAEA